MNRLVSSFVPKMNRALMKTLEVDIMATGPDGQTASDPNTINDARHRFVAGGANETMVLEDFIKALYALEKANVPCTSLVALVDPSVEVEMNRMTNLVNMSNNPRWEGIVSSGIATGMKFAKNIYGFDCYVSQNLKSGISETVSTVTAASGVANLLFSAAPDVLPIVGAIRQTPKVDSEYNKDLQREEYVTTMRYGLKLYRPENMVVCISDNDQVYS